MRVQVPRLRDRTTRLSRCAFWAITASLCGTSCVPGPPNLDALLLEPDIVIVNTSEKWHLVLELELPNQKSVSLPRVPPSGILRTSFRETLAVATPTRLRVRAFIYQRLEEPSETAEFQLVASAEEELFPVTTRDSDVYLISLRNTDEGKGVLILISRGSRWDFSGKNVADEPDQIPDSLPAVTIRGRVVRTNGDPVEGVDVLLRSIFRDAVLTSTSRDPRESSQLTSWDGRTLPKQTGEPIEQTVTGRSGDFEFAAPPGLYVAEVAAPGFRFRPAFTEFEAPRSNLTFIAEPGTEIASDEMQRQPLRSSCPSVDGAQTLPTPTVPIDVPASELAPAMPGDIGATVIIPDGRWQPVPSVLAAVGRHSAGSLLSVRFASLCGASPVLFLDSSGDVLGGASASVDLNLTIDRDDDYFLYSPKGGTICGGFVAVTVEPTNGLETRQRPAFLLDFGGSERVTLTGGETIDDLPPMDLRLLVDDQNTAFLEQFETEQSDARVFLGDAQALVEDLIAERLSNLFAGFGMQVVTDPADFTDASTPYSTIYFTSQRRRAPDDLLFDTVPMLAPADPGGVINLYYGFSGTANDIGNRIPDDDAIVYAGSFGGCNLEVLSTDIASLANALSNAAAHEMGHLLGLQHTFRRWDIMGEQASNTLVVELGFGRSQLVINGRTMPYLRQNPEKYFGNLERP